MNAPKKKVIIISADGVTYFVCDIKEVSTREFIDLEKECKKNKEKFVTHWIGKYNELVKQIEELKHEIKILKGEE